MDLFDGEGLEFGHVQNLDARRQRRDIADRIAALEKKSRQRPPADRECPHCGGELAKVGVSRCQHCGQEIDWAFGKSPCKPGEKYDLEQRIAAQNRANERRNEENRKARREATILAEIQLHESSLASLGNCTIVLLLLTVIPIWQIITGYFFPITMQRAGSLMGMLEILQYLAIPVFYLVGIPLFFIMVSSFLNNFKRLLSPHPHPDQPKAKHNNPSILAKEQAEELRKQAMQRRREAQKKKKSKQS